MNNDFEIIKQLLITNGKVTSATSGNSMKPLFRDGRDYATIIPLNRSCRPNDVLLYKDKSDKLILHRVIKSTPDTLILRGDGLYRNETDVSQSDILGIMNLFCRKGKQIECTAFSYRIYVLYIRLSYPIRYCCHKALRLLKRMLKK